MLLYEHDRTELIVNGLIKVAGSARFFGIVGCVFSLGGLLSLLGSATMGEMWFLPGIVGAGFGVLIGSWLGSLARMILEWMAQSLVAQGELLAATKRR
jgi:hypothetical protein